MNKQFFSIRNERTPNILNIFLILLLIINSFSFMGGLYNSINSFLSLIIILILYGDNRFYLIVPLMIFYSSTLVLPFNIKIFDIYLILFMLKLISNKKLIFNNNLIVPFYIVILYSVLVISKYSLRTSLVVVISFIFIFIYISNFLSTQENYSEFIDYYIYATISASLFGMWNLSSLTDNYLLVDGIVTSITRNIGTFNDPNYFGFFLNIAIFALITNPNRVTKNKFYILLFILYISLITTLSITGILCNITGLIVMVIIKGDVNHKLIFRITSYAILGIVVWNFAKYYDLPIVENITSRLKSLNLGSNLNVNLITSSRLKIWKTNIEHFANQNFIRVMLGGNFVTDYGRSAIFDTVSHQSFIDMLLNFGIIGSLLFMWNFTLRTINLFMDFKKTKEDFFLTLFFVKYIWLFYAFGLSMFPSWIFNIFFFI